MLLHINGKDTMGKLKLETAMSYVKVQVYTNYILLKYKPWHQNSKCRNEERPWLFAGIEIGLSVSTTN